MRKAGDFCCDLRVDSILHVFLSSADFFQNQLFRKKISGTPLECDKNCLDPDQDLLLVGVGLGPNCLQRLSADDTRRQSKDF